MADISILRLPVVMARTGLGRTSIYEKVAAGDFPEPINIGPRAVGWIADEVQAWIESRIDASRSVDQADNPTL